MGSPMAKLKLSFPTFRQAPSVVCGTGSLRSVTDASGAESPTLFLTSGSDVVAEALDRVLSKAGGQELPRIFRKPAGEPTWSSLEEAATAISELNPGLIVAIGGGSVLDWARLAWARCAGHLDQDSAGKALPRDPSAPRFWLIPTTCSTGAEAGDVAVYTTSRGDKAAVTSPDFLAERVVLDARFLASLAAPAGLLEGLVCDALSHGLESYLSLVPNYLGKAHGIMAVRSILANPLVRGGSDVAEGAPDEVNAARERLMEAGFIGGVAAANCSVGVVHAFAHSIGVEGVGHGLANAAALPAGMQFNASTAAMGGLLEELGLQRCEDLVSVLRPLTRRAVAQPQAAQLRGLLGDAGCRRLIADRMAADVALRSNPRRASRDELFEFVEQVAAETAS